MNGQKSMLYTRFERFWHWSQAGLIFLLALTGFDIHNNWELFGYHRAGNLHAIAALALIVLWIFAIFWHLTTGQWRHYVPTTKNLGAMLRYYAVGIFRHEPHPVKKTYQRKHNPLQALTYLGLKVGLFPLIWVSGLAYLFYGLIRPDFPLEWVALLHTAVAWLMVCFVIVHIYMTTTGHTVTHHVQAMISGYDDEVDEEELIQPRR